MGRGWAGPVASALGTVLAQPTESSGFQQRSPEPPVPALEFTASEQASLGSDRWGTDKEGPVLCQGRDGASAEFVGLPAPPSREFLLPKSQPCPALLPAEAQ